jgi:hypothetical protein
MFDRIQTLPKLDVLASDRMKVGVVDHLDGERVKLARHAAPDGQYHYIPLGWVDQVDSHVHLNVSAAMVVAGWPGRCRSALCCCAPAELDRISGAPIGYPYAFAVRPEGLRQDP